MYLGNNPTLKSMWSSEIVADRAYLLGMILPEVGAE